MHDTLVKGLVDIKRNMVTQQVLVAGFQSSHLIICVQMLGLIGSHK